MLVYGKDKFFSAWASQQIFGRPDKFNELAVAIGLKDGEKIQAAVVYTDYRDDRMIEISIASVDKRWATRHNIRAFLAYPFIQLGLERVQSVVAASNKGAISTLERLGFTFEGRHRRAYWNGEDALSYGLLKEDCKWIENG